MSSDSLPHIILIIMDSVAAKRCSAYGHHRDTTPGLCRIAEQGSLYKNCFAPSAWTIPSHASLFTGLYPAQHGCHNMDLEFPGNYYTLPEILRGLGYYTVGLSSNLVISRDGNFHWGFDEFHVMDTLFNCDRYYNLRKEIVSLKPSVKSDFAEVKLIIGQSWKNRYYTYPLKHLLDRLYRKYRGNIAEASYHATERSLKLAKKLLKGAKDKPLFLFFNFMETHGKYNPPQGYDNIIKISKSEKYRALNIDPVEFYFEPRLYEHHFEILQLLYEQEIAYLDDRLWDLYNFLEKTGLKGNTLFIVTADHGESLGEHGIWGHIFGLYNELIHIPLIIRYPRQFGLEGEHRRLVQLHDLFATLLEISGAPVPVPESSRSLLGPPREYALAEFPDVSISLMGFQRRGQVPHRPFMQPCRAIIDNSLGKLIQWADGRLELYDLPNDYAEAHNLISRPDWKAQAEHLQTRLGEILGPFVSPPLEAITESVKIN
jgi:arylsulfatase A-like enzyme